MRICYFISFAVLLGLSACHQNNNQKVTDASTHTDTLLPKSNIQAETKGTLNLDQVPISKKDLGSFPYLYAPEGYKYSGDINKKLEEKYFFYNDSLVKKVEGTYFHTTIFPLGDGFEDTFVVATYKKAIEKLGGIEIYSGGLPNAGRELIEKEKPAFVKDMYDPMPYTYKQYLIRTPAANIWIELCHGLNSNQIDFSVVKAENLHKSMQ